MSIQDMILTSLVNLQTDDGDVRGVLNHILNTKNGSWMPLVDMIDCKSDLSIYVELPGIHKNLKVDFSDNKLTISGNKQKSRFETISGNEIMTKNELGYGKYSRTITLPIRTVNKKHVSTMYDNGILYIKINKNIEHHNQFFIEIKNSGEEK